MKRGAGRRSLGSVAKPRSTKKASNNRGAAAAAAAKTGKARATRTSTSKARITVLEAENAQLRAELAKLHAAPAGNALSDALSPEQWTMAGWIRSIANAVSSDPNSPGWTFVRDAWHRTVAPDEEAQLRQCSAILYRDKSDSERPKPAEIPSLIRNLADVDPAFAKLTPETFEQVLDAFKHGVDLRPREARYYSATGPEKGRRKPGGNSKAGWIAVLARLAIACGALGATRDTDPKTLVERFKKTRERDPDKWNGDSLSLED